MQARPIKTYSRKRKRTFTELPASWQATDTEMAADTLPTPNSSPRPLSVISPNSIASLPPTPFTNASPTHEATNRAEHEPEKGIASKLRCDARGKAKKMTQLTLDLGGPSTAQKRCAACGMEYVPSNAEDAKLHRDFHSASVGGVDVPGGGLAEKWRVVARCARRGTGSKARGAEAKRKRPREGALDLVVEVGRHDAVGVRNLAKKVLDVVEKELGGVKTESRLWAAKSESPRRDPDSSRGPDAHATLAQAARLPQQEMQKVYLYVQDSKCVGLCLAERISTAFKVEPSTPSSSVSSSISTSQQAFPAVLGISRIWVSREFRRQGIARELLDIARREFLYSVKVERHSVAFSEPTESGGNLARAYFGMEDGWMVYG